MSFQTPNSASLRLRHIFALSAWTALLPIAIGICLPAPALAQLQVTLNKSDGNYATGEQVVFQITSTQAGAATYSIGWDTRSPNLVTGSLQLAAGQTVNVAHTAAEPGFLLFSILQNGQFASAGAAVDARSIAPLETAPGDFDAFWAAQKNALAAIPLDPQLELQSAGGNSSTWQFSLAIVDGRRVHGYISVPIGAGPFPAVVVLPAYGDGANVAAPEPLMAEFGGVIAVSMSLHNAPPDEVDPNAYQPDDIADKSGIYYRYGILGAIRILDYLHSRSDFDGEHIGLTGVSQGGGLAILTAGIDERVDLIVASNPALCEHTGLKYNKASGFPYYVQRSRFTVGTPQHEAATVAASKYYDAVHAASRFRGVAWLHTGYRDDISPPATTMAAWNQLRCQKILTHLPLTGHSHPGDYWDGRFDLFRRHFPVQPSVPNATTTGYSTDAGGEQTLAFGTSANLSGSIFHNNQAISNLQVSWRMVAGPGNVNFSNPASYQTGASFPVPGEYWLEFSALDKTLLPSENKFFELADFVKITLQDPNPGNDPPTVTLSVQTLHSNGSVTVRAAFSEPVTGLTAGDFTVSNGTAMVATGSGATWFIFVQPNNAGTPTVQLSAGGAFDAGGAGNLASNLLELPFTPSGCNNVTFGGEISGDQTECEPFSAQPIASVTDASGGTGSIIYSWQQTFDLQNPAWTDIPGANSSNFDPGNITQTTWFHRSARRSGCSNAGTFSNPVAKKVTTAGNFLAADPAAYCQASGSQPWWEWIEKVELGNRSFPSYKEQYGDFSDFNFSSAPGDLVPLALTPGFGFFNTEVSWRIWADFNFDGDFDDAGELLFSKKSNALTFGQIQIPASASTGATRLRVAMKAGGYPNPCGQFLRGEVEDYTLLIAPTPPPSYCEAKGEQPWWEWIANVDFAGLQSASFKEGYANFTERLAVFEKGETYQLFVTAGRDGVTDDPIHFAAWLDLNADGDFEDPGEQVLTRVDSALVGELVHIPQAASSGMTRLRVAVSRDGAPSPCQTFSLGEVEDYTVVITGCDDGNRLSAVLDFFATLHTGNVETSWVTNTDFKNAVFVVERSADGVNFEAISFSEPVTEGYFPNLYRWLDEQPLPGTSHYRLRQVHQNGSFKLSEVRTVTFDFDPSKLHVFPNPVSGDELMVRMASFAGHPVKLLIVNEMGVAVREVFLEEATASVYRMELSGLRDGMYFLWAMPEGRRAMGWRFVVNWLLRICLKTTRGGWYKPPAPCIL